MARKIGLVAASKRRRGGIARAHEQFDPSPVFRRARDFCDRSYSEWYVLSTLYQMAPPQQVIGADEPALYLLSAAERMAWAEAVARQLHARVARSAEPLTYVLYASQLYAELLVRVAPDLKFEMLSPVCHSSSDCTGMMIGCAPSHVSSLVQYGYNMGHSLPNLCE
ncbi:MAG TPA: hypothetical protein VFW17_14260 [Ktedonobacterales bacterium]|nr:hypothetical protein [Ktedonobacterales bacterium]